MMPTLTAATERPPASGRDEVVSQGSRPAPEPAVRPAQHRDRPGQRRRELKLHGIASEAGPGLRQAAAQAWWSAQPPDKAIVYVLRIAQALFVAWDIERGLMTVHRWSPPDGYIHTTRTYL
jgi:hypothetical protein